MRMPSLVPAMMSSGSRSRRTGVHVDVRHAQERKVPPRCRERAAVRLLEAEKVRCLAVALQSDEDPLPHDRKLHRLHAIVVIANRAHAAVIVRSPVTLNCFDPYFNFPTSASLMKLVPA